jgi:hypothetical protein
MNSAKSVMLPARVAFLSSSVGGVAIVGTPGAIGDAGYSVFRCEDREHALQVMRAFPAARMPAWSRIEAA